MKLDRAEKTAIALICLAFVPLLASWPISSYFEAKAYNRLTGAHATTWEAMWVELRVQGEPTKRD